MNGTAEVLVEIVIRMTRAEGRALHDQIIALPQDLSNTPLCDLYHLLESRELNL